LGDEFFSLWQNLAFYLFVVFGWGWLIKLVFVLALTFIYLFLALVLVVNIASIDFNFECVNFGRCRRVDFWDKVVDLFLTDLFNITIAGRPLSFATQLTQTVFVVVPYNHLSCPQSKKLA
jgi:hypothetical protein